MTFPQPIAQASEEFHVAAMDNASKNALRLSKTYSEAIVRARLPLPELIEIISGAAPWKLIWSKMEVYPF